MLKGTEWMGHLRNAMCFEWKRHNARFPAKMQLNLHTLQKSKRNAIPNAHHMFETPISLQIPLISPSEFIPQIFFIRLATSSPQISRIWSDASPRLHFNVCKYEVSRSRKGRKINPVAKTITSASSSDPFSNLRPDSVISDILLSFLSLIFLSIMSCDAPVSVCRLYPSWLKWAKGIPR